MLETVIYVVTCGETENSNKRELRPSGKAW